MLFNISCAHIQLYLPVKAFGFLNFWISFLFFSSINFPSNFYHCLSSACLGLVLTIPFYVLSLDYWFEIFLLHLNILAVHSTPNTVVVKSHKLGCTVSLFVIHVKALADFSVKFPCTGKRLMWLLRGCFREDSCSSRPLLLSTSWGISSAGSLHLLLYRSFLFSPE